MENNINAMISISEKGNKKTICFATMCKNEEHCIRDTLESVYKYIDTWVVHDTGSTDNTCKIVEDFFKEKNIPGELFIGEWVGFDYNKTQMFNKCYNRSDYILHLDADDIFHGEPDFSLIENHDAYYFNCLRGNFYNVLLLFNNRHHWKFCGVAHTTIKNLDNPNYSTSNKMVSNDFYQLSRDTGSRSYDPDKYLKDANRLKDQFFKCLYADEDDLLTRSAFYTAQSYMDSSNFNEAIQWYTLYINLKNTWIEEVFESHIRITKCLITLGESFNRIKYHIDTAINIFKDRSEPYLLFGKYCNSLEKWEMGYSYLIKTVDLSYEDAKSKYSLFVSRNSYEPYNLDKLSVSCWWTKKYEEGLKYLLQIKESPLMQYDIGRIKENESLFNSNIN